MKLSKILTRWDYGTMKGVKARRNRVNGKVQIRLFEKGSPSNPSDKDYYGYTHTDHDSLFKPDEKE